MSDVASNMRDPRPIRHAHKTHVINIKWKTTIWGRGLLQGCFPDSADQKSHRMNGSKLSRTFYWPEFYSHYYCFFRRYLMSISADQSKPRRRIRDFFSSRSHFTSHEVVFPEHIAIKFQYNSIIYLWKLISSGKSFVYQICFLTRLYEQNPILVSSTTLATRSFTSYIQKGRRSHWCKRMTR